MRIRCGVRWTTKARLLASMVAHPRISDPFQVSPGRHFGRDKRNYDDNSLAVLLRREPADRSTVPTLEPAPRRADFPVLSAAGPRAAAWSIAALWRMTSASKK